MCVEKTPSLTSEGNSPHLIFPASKGVPVHPEESGTSYSRIYFCFIFVLSFTSLLFTLKPQLFYLLGPHRQNILLLFTVLCLCLLVGIVSSSSHHLVFFLLFFPSQLFHILNSALNGLLVRVHPGSSEFSGSGTTRQECHIIDKLLQCIQV